MRTRLVVFLHLWIEIALQRAQARMQWPPQHLVKDVDHGLLKALADPHWGKSGNRYLAAILDLFCGCRRLDADRRGASLARVSGNYRPLPARANAAVAQLVAAAEIHVSSP
jgi:hypothetical protein